METVNIPGSASVNETVNIPSHACVDETVNIAHLMKKLSRLQKQVIVTLLAPGARELTKREFSQYVYDEFFGRESRSAQASLSRAYRRLEKRGYLKRSKKGWELTPRGEEIALLEWQQERSRYPHIILES